MSKRSDEALAAIDATLREFDSSYTPPEPKCESTSCDGCASKGNGTCR